MYKLLDVMKDIVHCGYGVFMKDLFIVFLTIVTWILIAVFQPHTAGLHQATVSIYCIGLLFCTTVLVSDWCIMNLAHGWLVSIRSIVGIIRGGKF